jgi:hypothetical protein
MSLVQFRTASVGVQPGTKLAQMMLEQSTADLAWLGVIAAG